MPANSLYFSRNVNRQMRSVVFILSPYQTIATFQRNISQYFMRVCPTCCDILGVVGSGLTIVKYEPTTFHMSNRLVKRAQNVGENFKQEAKLELEKKMKLFWQSK